MAIWGKRGGVEDLDKRWKQMAIWGKRGGVEDLDKRWKQMAIWGKRDAEQQFPDKRWGKMAVWGKRSAGEENSKRWKQMSIWGKRSDNSGLDNNLKYLSFLDNIANSKDKRWKQMASWGKRNGNNLEEKGEMDKKWRQMSSWGKRAFETDITNENLVKKWKQLSLWGKRSGDEDDEFNNKSKKWKQMSSWGKRSDEIQADKKWKQMSSWGKRWANYSSWGKRAALEGLVNSRGTNTQDNSANKSVDDIGSTGDLKRSGSTSLNSLFSDYEKRPQHRWRELSLWGKRGGGTIATVKETVAVSPQLLRKKWHQIPQKKYKWPAALDKWGKRPSWQNSGFTSWGKRGVGEHDLQTDTDLDTAQSNIKAILHRSETG